MYKQLPQETEEQMNARKTKDNRSANIPYFPELNEEDFEQEIDYKATESKNIDKKRRKGKKQWLIQ